MASCLVTNHSKLSDLNRSLYYPSLGGPGRPGAPSKLGGSGPGSLPEAALRMPRGRLPPAERALPRGLPAPAAGLSTRHSTSSARGRASTEESAVPGVIQCPESLTLAS